jgi:hypothetical protein
LSGRSESRSRVCSAREAACWVAPSLSLSVSTRREGEGVRSLPACAGAGVGDVLSSRTLLGPTDRPLGPAPSDRTIDDELTRPPQLRDRRREAISSLAAGLCRPCCGCPHPVDQRQQASSTPSSDQRPGRGPRMLRRGRRHATEISFADGPCALAGKHTLLARPKGCRPIPLYSLCQDACRERAGRDPAAVGRCFPPCLRRVSVRPSSEKGPRGVLCQPAAVSDQRARADPI